jgi:glutamyl-tRNA synthetase/glutamyl-Q tRNA(Asp) synthetase
VRPTPDLAALSSRLGAPPVTRFAPSPTGYLHLGHVVNAICVWGIARALGGRVRLRIEDHDRLRSRPAFEAAILEDLDWLGFVPDEGRHPVDRQSDRLGRYEEALAELRRASLVYACECSRKEIGGERYDGRCRHRRLEPGLGRGIRVQLGAGSESFEDGWLGRLEQTPADQCGDLLVQDRDGHWTYQFAVTVDDIVQGVTLVIRGADLVSSTGRQLALARLLGRPVPPQFVHHGLILDPAGEKLSKSAGDTGVRELRSAGLSAADVIGTAAARIGLLPERRPIRATDVAALFEPNNPRTLERPLGIEP